jgi:acetyltransferase
MPHLLDSFFAPDSIALIGASRDQEKIPGRLLSMLRKNGFPGKLYPINPNYGDIDGLKCYPSIADVGQPIDLAIVIIPARAVLGALEQCAAVGVKNAVIISSGCGFPVPMRKASTARSSASPPPSARPSMSSRTRRS